ncbi:uncharacterized protein LOC131328297 [Rhododendron vialii]|uniref:uncharacterized protein LOC131328297 n=1 Tax=Rhododendron vialii TaxID=182163 RepID=UPI00265FEF9A|nr:uncharacterized protein LOC131328297 [Rhododendron vialii]
MAQFIYSPRGVVIESKSSGDFLNLLRTYNYNFVPVGFDVGDVPAHVMLEMIRPVCQQSDPLALQQGFSDMAKVALGVYNENQGTRYQFFQVIKVNYFCTGALWYYITFQAKNVMDGSQLQNFQALTTPGPLESEAKVKVEFCRVEPKPELPEDCSER